MTHGGSTLHGMAHTNYSYTRLYYSLGRNYVALLYIAGLVDYHRRLFRGGGVRAFCMTCPVPFCDFFSFFSYLRPFVLFSFILTSSFPLSFSLGVAFKLLLSLSIAFFFCLIGNFLFLARALVLWAESSVLSNFDMIALQNFAKLGAVDGLVPVVVCSNVAMCALFGCMGSLDHRDPIRPQPRIKEA